MALIIVFHNDSTAPLSSGVGNYKVEVLVGDGGPNSHTIERGRLEGHKRADGWKALVRQYLEEYP